jgi:hypothetical protein
VRIAFSSISGFKTKAKHLGTLLGLDGASAGLEALARLSGFTSYHEVRSTADLSGGMASSAEDALPRLQALRPGLTRKGALDILVQLALFPGAKAVESLSITGLLAMQPPDKVTFSSIAPFLRKLRVACTSFSTPEFAARFSRTVREAQSALNEYVDVGFLTHTGFKDGLEMWGLSRDGMRAFGVGGPAAKLSKKDLLIIEEALRSKGPLLAKYGVQELSLSGRPAFGRPGGPLVVGVRLLEAPFSRESDIQILVELYRTLRVVGGDYFSVLLFEHHKVPVRLTVRRTIFGIDDGQTLVTPPERLDVEEVYYWERYKRMGRALAARGQSDNDGPLMFRHRMQREINLAETPIRCVRSDFAYPIDTDQYLRELKSTIEPELDRRRATPRNQYGFIDYSAELLAEVDYAISMDNLDKFVRDFKGRHDHGYRFERPDELAQSLSVALTLHWEDLAKGRAVRASRKRNTRPSASVYFAVFDGLHHAEPKLVGFVRQPGAGRNSFGHLQDAYNCLLARAPDASSEKLWKAGFSPAYVALVERKATEEEAKAFKRMCKEYSSQFKAIMVAGDSPVGIRAQYYRREEELLRVPASLQSAEMTAPVIPKVIRGWSTGARSKNLFDVLDSFKPAARARAARCIVNSEAVLMRDFARQAAQVPCTDVVVLGTKLTAFWRFESAGDAWRANIGDNDWSVALCFNNASLDIQIRWGEAVYLQRLSPNNEGYGHQYRGNLSGLHRFMDVIQDIRAHGLEAVTLGGVNGAEIQTSPEERLPWLVDLADYCLHGRLTDFEWGDGTSWPRLQVLADEDLIP